MIMGYKRLRKRVESLRKSFVTKSVETKISDCDNADLAAIDPIFIFQLMIQLSGHSNYLWSLTSADCHKAGSSPLHYKQHHLQ